MVSVCMATYNGAQFISQQLTSITSQLGPADEIIISDDGSTDNTLDIINSFQDKRIKILNVNFKAAAKNFENAISKARGDYIFLSDQDDIWMTNKVEVCIGLLQKYDVVVTDCTLIDENENEIEPSLFEHIHSGPGLLKNLISNTYYGCCMCFRKSILPVILPFPLHVPMHDGWIGFVADLFYKVHFEKQALVRYRRHGKNITPLTKSTAPLQEKIGRRINLLRYCLLLAYRKWIRKV